MPKRAFGAIGGRLSAAALIGVAAFALAACEDTRKVLGVDKSPPDEFRVVSRAPLTIPPDFSLRPPQPGAVRPQEGTVQQSARQALLEAGGVRRAPDGTVALNGATAGESALLGRVNGGRADPSIRQTLDRETAQLADGENEYLLDRLIFWRKDEPGTVINAPAEAQRLRENAALGRPVSEGDTPTIVRKRSRGWFEGLF